MQDNQNPGSFMSAAAGGTNGVGPELQALMSQQPNSGDGAPQNQNSQTLPPQAPQTAAIAPPPPQSPQGMPAQAAAPSDLQIALTALANFIKSHGAVHEAVHDVPLKKAQASALTAQNSQGGE